MTFQGISPIENAPLIMFKSFFINLLVLVYFLTYGIALPAYGEETNSTGQSSSQTSDVRSFSSTKERKVLTDSGIEYNPIPTTGPGGLGTAIYYNVHILGEVLRPGTYKILPSDRITDAVVYAGGILGSGSERAIQLRRQDSTRIVDLFSYKYQGTLNNNPYLMENDVVFVPVSRGEIQVEGPVNRPGNYEITRSISLASAIEMAGGLAAGYSSKTPIKIVRYNQEEQKEIIEVEYSKKNLRSFMVQKGDVVVVPHILITNKSFDYNLKHIPGDNIFHPTIDDNVYVIGAVENPGPYAFQPHMTHKEYMSLAGLTDDARLTGTKIIKRGEKRKKRITKNTIINPGDTIVVPTNNWRATTIIGWVSTITSLTLTTVLIYDQVNNN